VTYANGRGVLQNDKQAVKWYRLAAEQGYADAQNNLGVMYDNGEGVPQSDIDAYAWWVIAVANNNQRARNNMEIAKTQMSQFQIEKAQQLAKAIWARFSK
jgi:hypothetical protein